MKLYSPIRLLIALAVYLVTLIDTRSKPYVSGSLVGWSSYKEDYKAFYDVSTGWIGYEIYGERISVEAVDLKAKLYLLHNYRRTLEWVTEHYLEDFIDDEV